MECDNHNTSWDGCDCMDSTITHFLDGMRQSRYVVRRLWMHKFCDHSLSDEMRQAWHVIRWLWMPRINDHLLSIWCLTSMIQLWDCSESIYLMITYSLWDICAVCETVVGQEIDHHSLPIWERSTVWESLVIAWGQRLLTNYKSAPIEIRSVRRLWDTAFDEDSPP